jgi:DMSO/TMAO reductase YedYZ molybdopterin-dependent catalytic subunit
MLMRYRLLNIRLLSLIAFALIISTVAIGQSVKDKDPKGENPLSWKHPEMIVHNQKPWNMETPPHLLDDAVTPIEKMFVRNNGLLPADLNAADWTLTIEGEGVNQSKTYTLAELKSKFKHYTYSLVLECGGNGRGEINPPATGNQWGFGGVSCGAWTGVRLKDVLADVGLKENAVYIGYYGTDRHLSGDASKVVISRGVPMHKALEDETLLAFELNGAEIPAIHGYPLRLVIGGWPASVSGKWLHRLVVRDKVHDGPKMESPSYRVPKTPVEPGAKVPPEDMVIIESMPVKSVITYPKTGAMVKVNQKFEVRGHAWAGDLSVKAVDISTDYGQTWKTTKLSAPANRLAWQRFTTSLQFDQPGYYEVWVRATDEKGVSQPMVVPGWNPRGYLNNATHRIAVKVE